MFSRLTYTLRETFAGFKRNITLTVAAIITSAISLLIFGLTLLIQDGFDNLLQRWEGGVEMIVFVNAGTQQDGLDFIASTLDDQKATGTIALWEYCDVACSLEDADRVLAGDPTTRQLLTETNIPTLFKIVPAEATEVAYLRGLKESYQQLPSVQLGHAGRRAARSDRQVAGLRQHLHHRSVDRADVGLGPVDLEHDPHGDVRPPTRDRGDEAGRRDRLVHPNTVHARGPDPGLCSAPSARSASCSSSTGGGPRVSATSPIRRA